MTGVCEILLSRSAASASHDRRAIQDPIMHFGCGDFPRRGLCFFTSFAVRGHTPQTSQTRVWGCSPRINRPHTRNVDHAFRRPTLAHHTTATHPRYQHAAPSTAPVQGDDARREITRQTKKQLGTHCTKCSPTQDFLGWPCVVQNGRSKSHGGQRKDRMSGLEKKA